ncbi:MAG TPA: proton-conducting transporter membrane subunit, partial [Gemmataceae bacterium]|nr:proton-conducting transporter membrane subunit [Gemmataceae bacterium]
MGADATLSVLVVLLLAMPLAAAVTVALLGSRQAEAVRWCSLAATVINLVLAVILAVSFAQRRHGQEAADGEPAKKTELYPTFLPEFVPGSPSDRPHDTTWSLLQLGQKPTEAIQFYVGFDGLNVWLIVLTAVLMVSSVLVSWNAIQERVPEFYAWLLVLQTGMQGVFLAFDIVLFYVFFELTLVPLFFVIGIWGGPQRRYAARKFFIFTLSGSLITLLGLLGIVLACYFNGTPREQRLTFYIPELVSVVNNQLHYLHANP